MKIEIDTNDRTTLLQLEQELSRALSVVQFALGKQPQSTVSTVSPKQENESVLAVKAAIDRLPKQFNTSSVLGIATTVDRAAVKYSLSRLEETGVIRTVQKGQGRRPTVFEKI